MIITHKCEYERDTKNVTICAVPDSAPPTTGRVPLMGGTATILFCPNPPVQGIIAKEWSRMSPFNLSFDVLLNDEIVKRLIKSIKPWKLTPNVEY